MERTKYEVKRIAVFSAVKTFFLLGGCSGFISGLIQWLVLSLIWRAGFNSMLQPGLLDQPGIEDTLGGIVGAAGLILPFFGAMAGAVIGVVAALLLSAVYNLGARIWGGLELDLAVPALMTTPVLLKPVRPGEATPLPGGPAVREPVPPPQEPGRNDKLPDERPPAAMFE